MEKKVNVRVNDGYQAIKNSIKPDGSEERGYQPNSTGTKPTPPKSGSVVNTPRASDK